MIFETTGPEETRAAARQVAALDELARGVGQFHFEIHDAAARDHALLDDSADRDGVDVAARHDWDDDVVALCLRELARAQIEMFERGKRNGAGRFDDHLVLFEHEQNHLVDIAFGDFDEIVEELVEQREGQVTGTAHGDAFGRRDNLVGGDDAACVE